MGGADSVKKFDTLFPKIKEKKLAGWEYLAQTGRFNHPHRLSTIAMDGGISYTVDQRDYTANEDALSASSFVFSIDASQHPVYTRQFLDRCPLVGVVTLLNPGDFAFLHNPGYCWGVLDETYDYPDETLVGTCTRTNWTRPSATDTWAEVDSTDTDIFMRFTFFVGDLGGDPNSNGKDEATPTELLVLIQFSGTYANQLPSFGDDSVYRFPWVLEWEAEDYSPTFDEHLTTQNGLFGGGHAGSCSMRLVFTNLA